MSPQERAEALRLARELARRFVVEAEAALVRGETEFRVRAEFAVRHGRTRGGGESCSPRARVRFPLDARAPAGVPSRQT